MTAEEQEAARAIALIWERVRPQALQRLKEVKAAIASIAAGSLAEESRGSAESAAHKLAGALGSYGFTEGSEAARRAELALEHPTSIDPGDLADIEAALDAVIAQIDEGA